MPGDSSYRFTRKGVENPLRNNGVRDRVLGCFGFRQWAGEDDAAGLLRLAWETVTPATGCIELWLILVAMQRGRQAKMLTSERLTLCEGFRQRASSGRSARRVSVPIGFERKR